MQLCFLCVRGVLRGRMSRRQQAAEAVVRTRWMLVLGIGLAAEFTLAQTYTVPEDGNAPHKCMYWLRLTDGGYVEGVAF